MPVEGNVQAKVRDARVAPVDEGIEGELGVQPAGELAGDPDFMASLARGLAVMRAFGVQAGEGGGRTISQLSRETGIPRSAVRRCLHTLERLGYVAAEGRAFSLRPKVLSLGAAYAAGRSPSGAAQKLLDQVSAAVKESCSLAVLDEGEILYLLRAATSVRIMSIDLRVGSRLPAYCTSMGRALLAHLPPAELRAVLARTRLVAHTEKTVTTRERLLAALEAVRRSGFALVDQELELGLRSIAVPVRDPAGRVIAALNVGTQAARVPLREMERRQEPALQAAAVELGLVFRA